MGNHGRLMSVIFSFLACTLLSVTAHAEIKDKFVAGEYVVKLKSGAQVLSSSQMKPMAAAMGGTVKDVIRGAHTMVLRKSLIERPEAVLEQLNKHPMVEYAEPNYIYYASALPNDSKLDNLWGLVNKAKGSGGVDINARDAWDITTGDKNVVVAVIDTGVNYNHEDLKNNMYVNQAEAQGRPGVDDDGNGYVDDIYGYDFANDDGDPMDDNDHGTHCAGTIGAEGNNGVGVVGVNWQVSIMALKFLTGSGGGTLDGAIKSIDYATQAGVDIMSNSWGGGGFSQNLKEAIERAEAAGILFVAAAGNERNNNDSRPSYPANYDIPNVISVAAVDSRGNLASFSNYGKNTVHVAAPGVDIYSTVKNGGYRNLSGTSMATPHVSGVAALLLAADSSMSYQQLKDRMLQTAVPTAALRNKVTYGFVDAYNSLTNTMPAPDPNDPSNWDTIAESVSTPHPYENDFVETYTLSVPGADKVAVHFSKFDTESGYDKVEFFDGSGQKVGEMSGSNDDSFSPVAAGDTIVLKFTSDYSITRYGFDIDAIAYEGGPRDDVWRSVPDPVSTPHPYARRIDQEVVFEKPGASEIRVQFGRFETEERYDFVYFYDGQGNLLDRWDGDHSGELSPIAQGDKIVIRITSDWIVQKYGFDVESVVYR